MLAGLLARIRKPHAGTVRNASDVEQQLAIPVLGELPTLGLARHADKSLTLAYIASNRSWFSEAIRRIRTRVVLAGKGKSHRIVMVTSSMSREGSTTLAANLAISLAQLERVLLIDAGAHTPALAREFGVSPDALSLWEALNETVQQVQHHHVASGVDVIAASVVLDNAAHTPEFLRDSLQWEQFVARYDRVVVDAGSVDAQIGALAWSGVADAVVCVVSTRVTKTDHVRAALQALEQAGAHVIGVVLNDATNPNGAPSV